MPLINVRDNEDFEIALRRFRRACDKAGILSECRKREFHETTTEKRQRQKAAAVKRYKKKLMRERPRPLRKSRRRK